MANEPDESLQINRKLEACHKGAGGMQNIKNNSINKTIFFFTVQVCVIRWNELMATCSVPNALIRP